MDYSGDSMKMSLSPYGRVGSVNFASGHSHVTLQSVCFKGFRAYMQKTFISLKWCMSLNRERSLVNLRLDYDIL